MAPCHAVAVLSTWRQATTTSGLGFRVIGVTSCQALGGGKKAESTTLGSSTRVEAILELCNGFTVLIGTSWVSIAPTAASAGYLGVIFHYPPLQ